MRASIKGVKIKGICSVVPAQVFRFEDELKYFPFPEKSSRRLARVMGFREHRIADEKTSPCDLACYALSHIFKKGWLNPQTLQGLLVVAQMADYPIPGNSKVIHGQLNLSRNTYCSDLYENCTGFISGLYNAACQISAGAFNEIALVVTDGNACRANKLDRNTYPLAGDAAAVCLVSASDNPEDVIHFAFQNDGSRLEALQVPAGGCRIPYSAATAKVEQDEMGNYRSLNDVHMDGTAVFQFVMKEVPEIIAQACEQAKVEMPQIQWHLTHQPNRFMLEKLADLLKVPREILFNNIVENFGNSSSATIPLNITYNLGNKLLDNGYKVCMSAFGAGLSTGAAIANLGPLKFCELIEHPGNGAISE